MAADPTDSSGGRDPRTEVLSRAKLPVQAIIFDFDYTLADSSGGIIESINFALSRLGLPLAADAVIRRTIGLPLSDALVMLGGQQYTRYTSRLLDLEFLTSSQARSSNAK